MLTETIAAQVVVTAIGATETITTVGAATTIATPSSAIAQFQRVRVVIHSVGTWPLITHKEDRERNREKNVRWGDEHEK